MRASPVKTSQPRAAKSVRLAVPPPGSDATLVDKVFLANQDKLMRHQLILFTSVFFVLCAHIACQSVQKKPETREIAELSVDRKACFRLIQLSTGRALVDQNPEFCNERHSPNSTFKVPAAVMAFESGLLKSVDQVISWDRTQHDRPELNQDQTPLTWMDRSVVWVTQRLMSQMTGEQIAKFLSDFDYGNKDFSGGRMKAWLDSSLKISPNEQIRFLTRLWREELPVSKDTIKKTKQILFIKDLNPHAKLYGKTGTGCIESLCAQSTGRMQGWFVGIVEKNGETYAFAAFAEDLKPQAKPAGPRLRATVTSYLESLEELK
jgi:beta-lactamase class D